MKKGFTLVELLAVIVILAVILVIAIPQVLKVVDNSRLNAYIKNEEMVLKAVDVYASRNTGELPGEIGGTIELSIKYLVTEGLLTDITNPYNKNEDCNGYVTITKISDTEYDYTSHLKCGLNIYSSSDDGLVGHWKLDGNTFDYSINNNHGINYNSIPTKNRFGTKNKSMSFNGVDSSIEIDSLKYKFEDTDNFSILMWAQWFDSNRSFCTYRFHLSRSQFRTRGTTDMRINSNINDSNWYHVAVVYNGSYHEKTLNIYINGEHIESISSEGSPLSSYHYTGLTIGRTKHGGGIWSNVNKDDIRIYNRALLETEIKQIYNSQK